ncbi:MAG: hypothetical protein QG670_1717, partial [Thermoproteota archaeon]|nr:hypothetical protein [Thermoproteota archaeon]
QYIFSNNANTSSIELVCVRAPIDQSVIYPVKSDANNQRQPITASIIGPNQIPGKESTLAPISGLFGS